MTGGPVIIFLQWGTTCSCSLPALAWEGTIMATDNIEDLCQKAREAIVQHQPEKARQLYTEALAIKDDSPDVHYGLATVCFQLKDLLSASHHFKEVTRLDPQRAGAFINLEAVYNLLDQMDEAITVLRRGIQLDSHRAEGYYNLALVHRRKNQLDLAVQAYREALRVNPQMADAHYNLANIYYEKEQFGLAVNHYKQALQLRPQWDKANTGMAQAEAALAQFRKAGGRRDLPDVVVAHPKPQNVDLDKTVDPVAQAEVLTNLHRATIETEKLGRQYLKVVQEEIENNHQGTVFLLALPGHAGQRARRRGPEIRGGHGQPRNAQRSFQSSVERVRTFGDKLFK